LIALAGVLVALISMVYYNWEIAVLFAAILGVGFIYFQLTHRNRTV
jgi:ethanolamine permease